MCSTPSDLSISNLHPKIRSVTAAILYFGKDGPLCEFAVGELDWVVYLISV